jgi:predicted lipase
MKGNDMFERYRLAVQNYNPINSYLTMLASHHVFPDHYNSIRHLPETSTAQIKLKESVYETQAQVWFRRRGFRQAIPLRELATGVNAFVLSNDDYSMVVFRGTEMASVSDFLLKTDMAHNALAVQVRGNSNQSISYGGNSAWVHAGIKRSIRLLSNRLTSTLNQLDPTPGNQRPVVVTGHSLGGALATMAGYHLLALGYNVQAVYGHAAYMVGDQGFANQAERLNLPYYRTVNHSDPVPHIPQLFIDAGQVLNDFAATATGLLTVQRNFFSAVDRVLDTPPSLRRGYVHVPGRWAYFNRRGRQQFNPSMELLQSERRPGMDLTKHATARYASLLRAQLTPNQGQGIPQFVPFA